MRPSTFGHSGPAGVLLHRSCSMLVDAVVQCGTNMSLIDVMEKLEPVIGRINVVTFWYALRENGFDGALAGGGRLLHEF